MTRYDRALAACLLCVTAAACGGTDASGQAQADAAQADAMQTDPAQAEIRDLDGRAVGEATLEQTPNGLVVHAEFSDLPPGPHAFHIHETGSCEPPFQSAGTHFNPLDRSHGLRNADGPHAGDMPNVFIAEDGTGTVDVFARDAMLDEGPSAILDDDGAALMLHAGPDDYRTGPSGDGAPRIACGVITR